MSRSTLQWWMAVSFTGYVAAVFYVYVVAEPIPRPASSNAIFESPLVFEGRLEKRGPRGPASVGVALSSNTRLAMLTHADDPSFTIHFDSNGLIVQADGDGGDTAQRIGMLFYLYRDQEAFEKALNQLEIAPGTFVRHPYQEGFRSDPNRFSRDQQRPLVIAMGAYGMHDRLWRLAKAQISRLGKYQNKDYLGPANLGEYLRAFRAWPLYPLLFLTDFGLVVSSLDIAMTEQGEPDHVDDNNHLMALIQSKQVMPTPISWLAVRIYKDYRPKNYGTEILGESGGAQGAISWYHRLESGGNPFIAELYRPAISSL